MYRTVSFIADYANEWRFDSRGTPVSPGCRELAEEIARFLSQRVAIVSPVSQHSYYGWGFEAQVDSFSFYLVLDPVDRCYLTISLPGYWTHKLLWRNPKQTFDRFCAIVSEVLEQIPKVGDIVWEADRKKVGKRLEWKEE